MIIPWQKIDPETLRNLIREFVLREGTDYGENEISLEDKIDQVKSQLESNEACVVFSELHETVDIQLRNTFQHEIS
ncbi:YheU family protein [Vibrio marisflavi]|uniref:UPF0270 protein VMF7928_03722 n=1 Tax=Vibrio marisflavi CECT 7928 TaxID=634439 RepID=A0ABN8E9Q0_9VIBR|nr:YheU family protein [Vibrio marisflavi]CAH0541656.1 hypothetical protein VMF7928_03722 [Vibrio marisflavi CECT 7928]